MKYVIKKGNKKLYAIHHTDIPCTERRYIIEGELQHKFTTNNIFKFYNDGYTVFNSTEDAVEYIKTHRDLIENERLRYEKLLSGSTDKILKYIDSLKIVQDDDLF